MRVQDSDDGDGSNHAEDESEKRTSGTYIMTAADDESVSTCIENGNTVSDVMTCTSSDAYN